MTNFFVKDANANTVEFKSTTLSTVETPHKNAQLMVSNVHVTNTNPVPVSLMAANAILTNTNPVPVSLGLANATLSNSNPVPVSANGQVAHDAAVAGSPVRIGGRALNANYTAVANNDAADIATTLVGAVVNQPFAPMGQQWTYAAATGGIADTSDVALAANAGTGFKNYIVSMQLLNTHETVNTEVVIKSAATVKWRGFLRANAAVPTPITFNIPVATAAAEPLNFACVTTGANVYVSAQGFIAP